MNPVVLQADNITKKFPGVIALKAVGFDLRSGEIHGLSGENGAGKSTLIKLLSGIYPYGSYEGNFFIHGQLAKFRSLADAQNAGIAVIYQELALVNDMTVGENIFLGSEPRTARGLINWHKVYHEARLLLQKFKVNIDPSEPVAKLGMGQKQLVEIVKALSKNSNILVLDEPTAALAEHEVLILLDILRDLRSRGIASIYISHKLDEIFAVCDRITVLRDGASPRSTPSKRTKQKSSSTWSGAKSPTCFRAAGQSWAHQPSKLKTLVLPIPIPATAFLPTSIFHCALAKSSGSAV